MNAQPTVFLVDDDEAVRDSLTLLFQTAGIAVEPYGSVEAFLRAYTPDKPGCLLLDMNMPGMNGFDLLAELTRRGFRIPILFLTADGSIPMMVRAIKAGAIDFLTKPVQSKTLIERVQAAFLQDAKTRDLADIQRARHASLAALTSREFEVLKLVVTGLCNKEIAKRLGISHRTVEIHRARIMEKTHCANAIELVRFYDSLQTSITGAQDPAVRGE